MKIKDRIDWSIWSKTDLAILKRTLEVMYDCKFNPDEPNELIVYSNGNTVLTNETEQVTLQKPLPRDVTGHYIIQYAKEAGILDREAYKVFKKANNSDLRCKVVKCNKIINKEQMQKIVEKVKRAEELRKQLYERNHRKQEYNLRFQKNAELGKWTITKNRGWYKSDILTNQGMHKWRGYIRVDHMMLCPILQTQVSVYADPEDMIASIAKKIYKEPVCKYRIIYKKESGINTLKEVFTVINVEKTKDKCIVNGVKIPKNRVAMAIKLLTTNPKADLTKLNEFNTEQLETLNQEFTISYQNEHLKTISITVKVVYDKDWYVELFGKRYKSEYNKLRKLIKISSLTTKPEIVYRLHTALNISIKEAMELLNKAESVQML